MDDARRHGRQCQARPVCLSQGVQDGSESWIAYLSPQVIDHNQIIFGEADEPGAAIDGFRQQLAAASATWNRSGSSR